jgi:hypothetical protein
MEASLLSGIGVVKMLNRWPNTNASNSVGLKGEKYINSFEETKLKIRYT